MKHQLTISDIDNAIAFPVKQHQLYSVGDVVVVDVNNADDISEHWYKNAVDSEDIWYKNVVYDTPIAELKEMQLLKLEYCETNSDNKTVVKIIDIIVADEIIETIIKANTYTEIDDRLENLGVVSALLDIIPDHHYFMTMVEICMCEHAYCFSRYVTVAKFENSFCIIKFHAQMSVMSVDTYYIESIKATEGDRLTCGETIDGYWTLKEDGHVDEYIEPVLVQDSVFMYVSGRAKLWNESENWIPIPIPDKELELFKSIYTT